jgi:hypothetical protein
MLRTNPLFPYRMENVPRDPTSIGIAAITLFESLTATSIGFELASTVGTVLTVATLAGVNYALSKSQAQKGGVGFSGPSSINTPQARGTVRAAAAAQRIIYGRMLVGGVWSFYDDKTAPFQVLQLMLARGRISAVRSVTINKNKVLFAGGTPFDTILTPAAIEGQDYVDNLEACFRNGDADQVIDPLLTAHYPPHGTTPNEIVFDSKGNVTNLPASFRQQNIATASFRAKFGTTQEEYLARWGNTPFINPMIEVDGRPLFDPRDPTQDIEDESTYKFTYNGHDVGRNPSLIEADWIRQPFGGLLRNDQIRLDELARAADYDDGIVYDKAGNPRVRHQADGLIQLNENPKHVTEALLTANRAWIVNSRGRVGWVPAIAEDPVITITEHDLLGGFDFRHGNPKLETFNRVRTRFSPPEKDYADDDGPVLDRPDLRADEDADELLETTTRMAFTGDNRAAQWLAAQYLEESRLPRTLDLPQLRLHPRLLRLKVGAKVRVAFPRYPEVNTIYQLVKDGFSGDFSMLAWSLREYDKTITSRDRSADEQDFKVAQAA